MSLFHENLKEFTPQTELASMPDPAAGPKTITCSLVHAIVESAPLASRYTTKRRYQLIQGLPPGQVGIQEEMLAQGWSHSAEAVAESPAPTSSNPVGGIPPAPKGKGKKPAKKSQSKKA